MNVCKNAADVITSFSVDKQQWRRQDVKIIRSFPGTKIVRQVIRCNSLTVTFAPENKSYRELSLPLPGTFVLWNFHSHNVYLTISAFLEQR